MTETDRWRVRETKSVYVSSGGLISEYVKTLERYISDGWEQYYNTFNDDPNYLTLVRNRWETDAEYNKRKAKDQKEKERAEKAKVTAEEKRRKQYEKLKEEFGND